MTTEAVMTPPGSECRDGAPFTTVLFGKTGAGKTSTVRGLFGWDWPTDPVVACTREPTIGLLERRQHPGLTQPIHQVVDLPGLGESLQADLHYLPLYQHWVRSANLLLWIIQADTRAYKRDQVILGRLRPLFRPGLRFKLGLNQVDRLGVDEGEDGFDPVAGRPSEHQLRYLQDKIEDLFELFSAVLGPGVAFCRSDIIPYTATSGWGLNELRRLFFHS